METTTQVKNEHKKGITPSFFFTTLGTVITLIVVLVALVNLIFGSLDKMFPDMLNGVSVYGYNTFSFESIRSSLATIIIFAPLYLALTYFFNRESNKQTLTVQNGIIRKWSIYSIIFLSVLGIAIDLAVLVKYFVGGEITVRFILKVSTLFVLFGLVFSYYFFNLKNKATSTIHKVYVCVSIVILITSIIIGFSVIGSPKEQRKLQFDQRRVDDLMNIQGQVVSFYQQKGRLPERIDELVDPLSNWSSLPQDPEFTRGAAYEYIKVGELEFELCATFSLSSPVYIEERNNRVYPMMDTSVQSSEPAFIGGASGENWKHDIGRNCFNRKIDKERYPIFDNNPKPL